MKIVEIYKAVDGQMFESEDLCKAHDNECLGAEFAQLLYTVLESTRDKGYDINSTTLIAMTKSFIGRKDKALPILKTLVEYIEDLDEE